MVSDPAPEVRIATIQALEFSEDPLAIQALATCLKDEDVYVLIECITMLENMGDATAIARLRPLLSHYDLSVRNAAAQAIENLQ
jgi:HEAT repeat protein